jgi:acyl carrier protein
MDSDIFDRLKKFSFEQTGWEYDGFNENTSLETNLIMYGDDAAEYILAFSKEFSVDISRFMFDEYFSPEGGLVPLPGLSWLLGIKKEPRQKELTIKHLMKAVEAGRLDEDVINS